MTPPAVVLLVALIVGMLGLVVGLLIGRHRRSTEPDLSLAPVAASLDGLAEQVRRAGLEQASAQANLQATLTSTLTQQVDALVRSTDEVRREASSLRSILGRTGARGRWGELQLQRLLEASGLVAGVHYDEQVSVRADDGVLRPDVVVRMPGRRMIVIDAKVPMSAFLEVEHAGEAVAGALLAQHAADMIRHIDALSTKGYRQAFAADGADIVVMFLPAESLLQAAVDQRPDLLEIAFARNVVPATPTTLFAMLRTIGLAWREDRLAENAAEIQRLGSELHSRLSTMAGHLARLGAALDTAVGQYNKAIGSLESRVLVTARTFRELGATDDELAELTPLTQRTRGLAAAELIDGVDRAG